MARLRAEREKPLELRLWVTLLRDTYSQVDDITAFAEEVGIDSVEYQALNSMTSYSRFYTPELRRNILTLPEMKEIADDPTTSPALRNALLGIISVYQGRRCDIFMNTVMANWQGEVTPCCMLKAPDFQSFGNLNVDTLETLWNREDYRFFRFALQHGVILESCRECPDVASA
jgi:radical SAM protein with 4Fe4S-binding SPASM domain